MDHYQALYRETARYVNKVIRRKAITAKMIQRWVEDAKRIKQTKGTVGLVSHYKRLYKQVLTEQEIERLKHSARKTELSFRLIDVLVEEKVLTAVQAKWAKQYVTRSS